MQKYGVLRKTTSPFLTACGGKAKNDNYPLATCVISGEKLGSMGDPVIVHHDGKEIRLCCEHCLPKFKADPAKYAAMVK